MKRLLHNLRAELSVFATAFILRAVFALQWIAMPYFRAPQIDARIHQLWALDILHGHLLRDTAFYQSPFYPYLLALLYKLFGPADYAMLFLQAVVGAATAVLIFKTAQKAFGRRAGILAGILAAVYMPFIFYTAPLLKEIWVAGGLALFCLLALCALENQSGKLLFWCGTALGFTALSRGNALLLFPLPLIFIAYKYRPQWRKFAAQFALLAAGTLLPVLPATLHNYAAAKDFVLINYTSGFSFFIGNNAQATGVADYPLGIASAPQLEEAQAAAYAERAEGRPLKPSEISSFWMHKCFAFAVHKPGKWLKLTFHKALIFFNRDDAPDDYSRSFIRDNFGSLLKLHLLGFAAAAVLGIIGICLFFDSNSGAFFLLCSGAIYSFSVIITFISDRYRMPLAVFLLPFSALLVDKAISGELWPALKAKPWRVACAAALSAFCIFPKPFDETAVKAQGYSQLVWVYSDLEQYDKAAQAFSTALELQRPLLPETFMKAGMAYEQLGDIKTAGETYQAGIISNPAYPPAYINMAEFLLQNKQPAPAVPYLERALLLSPEDKTAVKDMVIAYRMMKDEKKEKEWEKKL